MQSLTPTDLKPTRNTNITSPSPSLPIKEQEVQSKEGLKTAEQPSFDIPICDTEPPTKPRCPGYDPKRIEGLIQTHKHLKEKESATRKSGIQTVG